MPAPSLPSQAPSRRCHRGQTSAGKVTGPGDNQGVHRAPWPKLDPQDAETAARDKVTQPFCKAAAPGMAVLIGANEEERGWLLHYMAAAGNLYAYTPFSLKVLGITLDI